MNRLNSKTVSTITDAGRYPDGSGLYFCVTPTGSRSWVLRYERNGRERMLGLGPYPLVGLADARERAQRARLQLLDNVDPVDARKADRAAKAVKVVTFKEASIQYHKLHEAKWSANHPFLDSLAAYAFPVIGAKDVRTINTDDVLMVVQPLWAERTETMRKLRSRIDAVMAWCIATGKRKTSNPAVWKGLLSAILPSPGKISKVQHLPALPWREVAGFMAELRQQEGVAARALELVVLTAVRTGEALGARWAEIDFETATWTVPGSRTKTGAELKIPLAPPVLSILKLLPVEDNNPFIFVGRTSGSKIGATSMMDILRTMRPACTVHGFRSTFRDWAAETTGHDNHVVEMALGHSIGSAVEKAYRRGDLFEKRVLLMADWARFCAGQTAMVDNVVPLRATTA